MAKNFHTGVEIYDGQVVVDYTLMPSESLQFMDGVIRKLEYITDDVAMPLGVWTCETGLLAGEEAKLARMGHVQAHVDFAANGFQAATADRGAIRSELAADKSELEGKISDEENRALAAEAGLQGSINQNASDIVAENTAMLAAVAAENASMLAAVAVVQADVDANESARDTMIAQANASRLSGDEALQTALTSEASTARAAEQANAAAISSEASTARAAESANAAAVATEKARAEAAEGVLQGNIDTVAGDLAAEAVTARAAETANASAISAEESRAVGQETLIRGEFAAEDAAKLQEAKGYTDQEVLAEKTRAEGAEAGLQAALNTEAATARAAEQANAAAISAEQVRAEAAENSLAGALQDEEDARILADSGLSGEIAGERARIDAILEASDADKDSFAEIVTLVNSIDAENDQAFAGHVTAYNAAKAALEQADSDEQAARIAGDNALQSSLDAYVASNDAALASEKSDRESGDAALQTGLDNEIASTNTRFASATSDRAAIRSEFAAADSAMETAFTAEIDALKVQDGTHTSDIASNAAAIVAEASRASTAEAGLSSDITAEQNRAEAQEAAIRSEFAAADVVLKGQLETYTDGAVDGEKVRAEAAELALSDAIDAEEAARILAVNNEASLRMTQDNIIQSAMGVHRDERIAEDASIRSDFAAADAQGLLDAKAYTDAEITSLGNLVESELNTEEAARIAGDAAVASDLADYEASNDAALAAEASTARAAELVNANAISAENQRATAAEGVLDGKINQEIADRGAAVTAEANARSAAVSGLQAALDAEIAATNADFVSASDARGVIAAGLAQELLDRAAGDVQGLADAKAYTDAEITSMETAFTAALDAEIAATNADILAAEQARIGLNTQLTADIATAKGEAIAHTDAAVAALVDSAPALLDTLNELAEAIGDDENFAATVAGDIATAKTELEGQVDAVEAALSAHEASNVASFQASTDDRAAIRTEMAGMDADLKAEIDADVAAEAALRVSADDALETAFQAADAQLGSDLGDEIAARVAGDLSVTAAFEAGDLALKTSLEADDAAIATDLTNEIARATAKENDIEAKQDQMIDGQVKVNFISNAVAAAAIMMPAGFEYHIVQNSGADAAATLPVLQPNYKVTVSLAAASAEPMEFSAPAGMTVDGEVDGKVKMFPGSSVTFVEAGGVYYMM